MHQQCNITELWKYMYGDDVFVLYSKAYTNKNNFIQHATDWKDGCEGLSLYFARPYSTAFVISFKC